MIKVTIVNVSGIPAAMQVLRSGVKRSVCTEKPNSKIGGIWEIIELIPNWSANVR